MAKKNVFKVASKSMKNIHALAETGVWGLPSDTGPYRTITKRAQVGDRIIFTNAGEPVAVGEMVGLPSEKVSTSFPDGEAYGLGFAVKVLAQGRVKRKARDRANMNLARGVVALSDNRTFRKCLKKLSK